MFQGKESNQFKKASECWNIMKTDFSVRTVGLGGRFGSHPLAVGSGSSLCVPVDRAKVRNGLERAIRGKKNVFIK